MTIETYSGAGIEKYRRFLVVVGLCVLVLHDILPYSPIS
jgi:hypothetical protein